MERQAFAIDVAGEEEDLSDDGLGDEEDVGDEMMDEVDAFLKANEG